MKTVFFDSGAGGLSVLNESIKVLPDEEYIYFADTNNAPYGTKSKEQILSLVNDAIDFINHKWELKALVLACNTATSVAVKHLRANYNFPIIGMEPAVKPAIQVAGNKNVLVCATDLTLKEDKLDKLIAKLNAKDQIQYLSLQDLVLYAENLIFDNTEIRAYLRLQFDQVDWINTGALVLGCTHFIYYQDLIRKMIPEHVEIVDGNLGTVNNLKTKITPNHKSRLGEIKYYISKERVNPDRFKKYFEILDTRK